MLKRLVEFIRNNFPDENLDDWLKGKYIQLNKSQLRKIAEAMKSGELKIKPASQCIARHFIFHFGDTLILFKKDGKDYAYRAELAWETDFHSVYSVREKSKGFYFIDFAFDDNYEPTLLETAKHLETQIRKTAEDEAMVRKIMPVLKGFISALGA